MRLLFYIIPSRINSVCKTSLSYNFKARKHDFSSHDKPIKVLMYKTYFAA
jgi:hypothetical protein